MVVLSGSAFAQNSLDDYKKQQEEKNKKTSQPTTVTTDTPSSETNVSGPGLDASNQPEDNVKVTSKPLRQVPFSMYTLSGDGYVYLAKGIKGWGTNATFSVTQDVPTAKDSNISSDGLGLKIGIDSTITDIPEEGVTYYDGDEIPIWHSFRRTLGIYYSYYWYDYYNYDGSYTIAQLNLGVNYNYIREGSSYGYEAQQDHWVGEIGLYLEGSSPNLILFSRRSLYMGVQFPITSSITAWQDGEKLTGIKASKMGSANISGASSVLTFGDGRLGEKLGSTIDMLVGINYAFEGSKTTYKWGLGLNIFAYKLPVLSISGEAYVTPKEEGPWKSVVMLKATLDGRGLINAAVKLFSKKTKDKRKP